MSPTSDPNFFINSARNRSSTFDTFKPYDQTGPYSLVKLLNDVLANQLPASSKRKCVARFYEILLKKVEGPPKDLPADWEDDDVVNGIKLEIFKRCKLKQTWNDDLCKKVINMSDILIRNKDSEYFKDCVGPALRMLLCMEYFQQKIPLPEKKIDGFFDTTIITKYLDSHKIFLSKEDPNTFFPKCRLRLSQSDGQLKYISQSRRFDYIFQIEEREKGSNDLDEGFVTPNDEHLEKSPCYEVQPLPSNQDGNSKMLTWEYGVVNIPPSSHKSWEKYGTVGKGPLKEGPFLRNDAHLLMDSHVRFAASISREQFLDDLLAVLVAIPSGTFQCSGDEFYLKNGISTEDLSSSAVMTVSQRFLQSAKGFLALTRHCESNRDTGDEDVITIAFKIALREYLYKYHTSIICARDSLPLKETSYSKLIITLGPLIEQITWLSKILLKGEELKGVPLLKYLFELMINTSNSSNYFLLSSLFLLPCIHYFRLIDDWIFLGKWHKDFPMVYFDMASVKDREGWVAAFKPTSDLSWLAPTKDLALCGKTISLLSLSKDYENLLNLFKSENRPKVKVCLNPNELAVLKEECDKYYERGFNCLPIKEEETVDIALSAKIAAEIYAQDFERKKLERKLIDAENKKRELNLREEDLVRSDNRKKALKFEEQAENMRIALEQEVILRREQEREMERLKLISERYEEHLKHEEKRMLRNDWRMKRLNLNEKRREFLSNELNNLVDNNFEHLDNRSFEKSYSNGKSQEKLDSAMLADDDDEKMSTCKNLENISIDDIVNENSIPSEPKSEIENLNEIFLSPNEVNEEKKECTMSDLEKNRIKVLSSNVINYDNENFIQYSISRENLSENEKNRNHVLGSHFDNKETDLSFAESRSGKVNPTTMETGCELSELQKNRNMVLGSVFESDGSWAVPKSQKQISNLPEVCPPNIADFIQAQSESFPERESNTFLDFIPEDKDETERNKRNSDSETSIDMALNKPSWFHSRESKMKGIFKSENPSIIPNKDVDLALLNKLVCQSLTTVLNIQVKLVNTALLDMFLKEYKFVKIAQKLKEYFFLHGEFGKHLTSSLSIAIETEEPSSLLTFYRLRNILAQASVADTKELSFIVHGTPIAFEHTQPKVLSSLEMTYKFDWPLNLIFTEKAIMQYNDVFGYMFALQRVSWHLERVSEALNFKPVDVQGSQYRQLQLYRYVMSQFVSTLHSYIVTTVFENCWQSFVKDLPKVKDLDELYRRHAIYIKDIKFKCFLDERSAAVRLRIEELLHLVLVFSRSLEYGSWSLSPEDGTYTHENFKTLSHKFSSFLSQARHLTSYVEKLVARNYQEDLGNLYCFLTINSFYISKPKK